MKKLINLDFDLNENCQNLTMFQKSRKREVVKFMTMSNFKKCVVILIESGEKEVETILFLTDLENSNLLYFIQDAIEKIKEEKELNTTFKYAIHSIN